MTGAVRAVVVACTLAAAVAGCGGGGDDVVATFTERDTEIRVEAGDRFAIRLASNPSTGYEWKVSKLPAIVILVDTRTEDPEVTRPGAGGHQVFELEALRAGDTTLELEYVRPFEAEAAPAETATFDVTVR